LCVYVTVLPPNDIDGNEAQVPFRFVMFEPRNNNHTFPNEGVAVVTVKRAAVLKNDATCASITVQGSIPIPWWTWVPVRVRLTNPGPSAWVPGAYQAVRLPYGSDFPFVAELPQLTKTIKPSETWDFMVYVASQEGGTIEALEIGMANAATQFGASCATTFEVGCQDGSTAVPLYTDQDQDGYGTGDLANHCRGPGFSDISGDCCDADRSVHPGAISPAYAPVASCGVEWDTACTGATGPEVCDGRDNDKNGIADDKIGCHRVILKMSGIDDNAVVWSGTSADGPGYCEVAYDNGPATGSCELTFDAINTGSEELTYVVKLGNGGGFITSGKFELLIDDNTVLLGEQLPVYAHSGWTYRNQFTVNFKYGYLVSSIENPCVNALDCNY
jgi:hypothetical protein